MNILVLTPYYPPVASSLSDMMSELAEALVQRGHDVTVVTAWLPRKTGAEVGACDCEELNIENDVRVVRLKSGLINSSLYIARGIYQLLMPYIYRRKIGKYMKDGVDVVIVYTPPLSYASIGSAIKRKYNAKYILNIQDIFPQNAIDLGILKNRILIRLFEHIERKAYASADTMTSHTQSSRRFLMEQKDVDESKIHYVPNWIDASTYDDAQGISGFREQHGLNNKYVFIFAGVMGPSQGLDYIVRVARRVQSITDDIRFLLVGDGAEKVSVRRYAEELGVENLLFMPLIPLRDYPNLLREADAGIVCLSAKNKTPVVPAKLWGYMASSMPVVAFLNQESDGHDIIREARCGYSAISDDPEHGAELVMDMYEQREAMKQSGRNGYEYVVKTFAKDACIDRITRFIC